MSKRKLTRRQAWRVNKIQEEREKRADLRTQKVEDTLGAGDLGPEQEGLVTPHFGTQVQVESTSGSVLRCHIRANISGLVTGDRVIYCAGDPIGVIVAQRDRTSELKRPDAYGNLKPVAANIDQIFVGLLGAVAVCTAKLDGLPFEVFQIGADGGHLRIWV